MTAKITASADGTKVLIGTAAENALQIDSVAKTIGAVAPYSIPDLSLGKSLATNGYLKLPGGLIIQWGSASITAVGNGISVPYPIVFPTAVLAVTASQAGNSSSAGTVVIGLGNLTAAGFDAWASSGTPGFTWIAVGY